MGLALALLSAGLSYVICLGEMFCVICGSVEKSQLLSFCKFQRAKLFSLFQLSVLTVNLLELGRFCTTTADQLETWWDLQRKSRKSLRNFRFQKTIKTTKEREEAANSGPLCKYRTTLLYFCHKNAFINTDVSALLSHSMARRGQW